MSDVKHWTIERSPFEVYNVDHGPLTHELCDGYTVIAALYVDHDSREAKLLASAPVMEDEITRLQADTEALRARVAGLVDALEYLMGKYPASRHVQDTCAAALAAHSEQGGGV